jgi:uncharacterized protein (DUF488 family)
MAPHCGGASVRERIDLLLGEAGGVRLLTVGHGNLGWEELLRLLQGAEVTTVADVRRFPGSRRHPHFTAGAMEEWLRSGGVAYRWEPRLGGRRRLDPEAADADPWWEVDAFRAYAAHTRMPGFTEALTEVLDASAAGDGETALMCSESLWWRCHRRLISDVAMLVHHVPVLHLAHSGQLSRHSPAAGARVTSEGLRYDVMA